MKYICTLLLLSAVTAQADSYGELVERAFAAIPVDMHEQWAFTETTRNSEGVFVATFDPRRDDAWRLLSVDDREPTQKELDEFLAGKAKERGSDDADHESMVADGSLDLLEETGDYWLFSFSPAVDGEAEAAFMEAVNGRLRIVKEGPYVAELTLENKRPIKPGKGVRIKTFYTHLEFAPVEKGGPALPQMITAEVKGRAMLVVGFDEQESVKFSNYRRAGPTSSL